MSIKVLVIGATGVAGSAFVEHIRTQQLAGSCDWQLIGVSRRQVDQSTDGVRYVTADLLADHSSIRDLRGITHVVFAGFVPAPDFAQQVAPNRDILVNCLRALDGNPLQRIVLIQGMKYYGSHLGAFKTPAREDDPRHDGENYYYAQQDVLQQHGIDWTCLRPHVICGTTSIGTPQNILSVIGVYASLMKSIGKPLHWPGTEQSFCSINQATDAGLLARAIAWSLESSLASNQAFNVTNGDFFRWQHLWPKVAMLFDMPVGQVQAQNLADTMPGLSKQWQTLVGEFGLQPSAMASIANWPFADYILRTSWDVMASTIKIRQSGFGECMDTEQMYLDHLSTLQSQRVLPAW